MQHKNKIESKKNAYDHDNNANDMDLDSIAYGGLLALPGSRKPDVSALGKVTTMLEEDHLNLCNFAVLSKSNETVLHVVLQRPLVSKLKAKYRMSRIQDHKIWDNLKKEVHELDGRYKECIDLLTNENRIGSGFTDGYVEQVRKVINIRDKNYGNTPLHYAVQNWPQEVIIN